MQVRELHVNPVAAPRAGAYVTGMQERRRLARIELAGGRAGLRRVLSWGIVTLAAIGAFGYVLPAHRVDDARAFHSNFFDGGPMPLFVFAAIALAAYALRRGRLGAGIATGVIATGGAVLALMPVFLKHFLAHVEHAYGEDLFAVGILGLFFGGAATAIIEPILYVTQRRALEREDPQFPVARLVGG